MIIAVVTVVAGAEPAWAAPPDAPAQPTVAGRNTSIVVTFAAPANDGGSPITGFTASCVSSDGGAPGSIGGPASPLTVTGLTNGNTYTCTVLATNVDGDGPASVASAPVVPNPTAPDAPAQPTVQAGDGSVLVMFVPPADGGAAISGFTASCVSSDGGAPGSISGAASPLTVPGLTNGNTYTCTVLATNINGDGPASVASNAVVPSTVPDAPAQPTVVPGNASVVVTFVAPADGGSAITGYIASCVSSDGGAPGSVGGTASPLTVLSLTNGNTYTCTVLASNVNGAGAASVASDPVVPVSTVPDTPAQPTVATGNARIVVSFVAPFDGGSAITGYTASCVSSNGGAPGNTSGASSPITVTGVSVGKTYTCTVSAANGNGPGAASPASATVVPTTVPGRPPAPTIVAGNGRITVTFRAPGNGGRPITAYRLWCTSSDGGALRTILVTHGPAALTTVSNNYTYTCLVIAINANGSSAKSPPSGAAVPFAPGFRMFSGDGGVFSFGNSGYYGSAAGAAQTLVVGMATTRDNRGYWLAAQDGSVFAFGDARAYGSMRGIPLNQPIVGITSTPTGHGFWLVARDGGIFAFGDAPFYGSTGNIRLNQPIVAMAPTASGHGYWFVAADGGLFAYGDARFFGSASGHTLSPVVGMASTATGRGYWLASANGQVFSFGDAPAFRSGPIVGLRLPIMGMAPTPAHRGYWLAAGDGGLFNFGDAPFFRWPGPLVLRRIIRGVSE